MNNIAEISVNGVIFSLPFAAYGTCDTAAGTAAKVVSSANFPATLAAGAHISVKFTYGLTVGSPTLKVNGTDAKPIVRSGTSYGSAGMWAAGEVVDFVYDGTSWVLRDSGEPTGNVIYHAGLTAPTGYLKCDGTVYNIADYPALAAFFQTNYGSKNYWGGNGSTTFAVPDWQGEFFRAAGTNGHTDQGSGAAVGVHQDATVIPTVAANSPGTAITVRKAAANTSTQPTEYDYGINLTNQITSVTSSLSNGSLSVVEMYTTRPTTTSQLACIKT